LTSYTTKQQAQGPERENKMDVKPTISALNKFTADIKELREQLENTTAAADPQEITPQQLIAALDILTECYNQMNGEQFTVSMNQDKSSSIYNIALPESAQNYWLEKFQIMREFGWCRLWSSVGGNMREIYASGILMFFKQYKAGTAHRIKLYKDTKAKTIKLTGNMCEAEEC